MRIDLLPSGLQWYFKIIARNGRVLATSERYHNKADARSAAQSIIDQAGGASISG